MSLTLTQLKAYYKDPDIQSLPNVESHSQWKCKFVIFSQNSSGI